jgi:hypothetical protein
MVIHLQPRRWPTNHPWKELVREGVIESAQPLEAYKGSRYKRFSVQDLIHLIRFNERLWDRPWWRWKSHTESGGLHYRNLYRAVEEALKYVHSMEHFHRRELARAQRTVEIERQQVLAAASCGSESTSVTSALVGSYRDRTLQAIIDDPTGEDESQVRHHKDRLWLCRWLRREAKAMGIKMPPPPQEPKPPGKKTRRHKRKR